MFSQFRQAAEDSSAHMEEEGPTSGMGPWRTSTDMMAWRRGSDREEVIVSAPLNPRQRALREEAQTSVHGSARADSADGEERLLTQRQSKHHDPSAQMSQIASSQSSTVAPPPPASLRTARARDALTRISALRGGIARSSSEVRGPGAHRHKDGRHHEAQSLNGGRPTLTTVELMSFSRSEIEINTKREFHDISSDCVLARHTSPSQEERSRPQRYSSSASRTARQSISERHASGSRSSPSRPQNINFEDLPAGVASRQEVGVVNDFAVPPTPTRGGEVNEKGPADGPTELADGIAEKDVEARSASVNRPKPKMLRRGDGTRKLREAMQKTESQKDLQAPLSSATTVSSFTQQLTPCEPAKREVSRVDRAAADRSVSMPEKLTQRESVLTAHHAEPSADIPTISMKSVAHPTSSFTPLPQELLAPYGLSIGAEKRNKPKSGVTHRSVKGDASASMAETKGGPSAEAIKTHLMSVFGSGLDVSVGGNSVDPEAAAIIDADLTNFPSGLWNRGRNSSLANSDIASFVARRDAKVTSYLDIRRRDFLSSMFPVDLQASVFTEVAQPARIARFQNGIESLLGHHSLFDAHQYHTLVHQFGLLDD